MANVQYRLSTRVVNGQAEVLIRFYASRVLDQRAHTRVYVPAHLWNEKKQRLNTATRYVTLETATAAELQAKLDTLEQVVLSRYIHDQYATYKGWLQRVVDEAMIPQALGITSEPLTAAKACLDYAHESRLSKSTCTHYEVLSRTLERFAANVHPLFMNNLTPQDITDLQAFLYNEYPRSHNTVVTRLRKFRAVCYWAIRKGVLNKCPFGEGGFKLEQEVYGTPTTLSMDEIEQIYRAPMPTQRMAEQRDIFVFQCYVGQRISDLQRMTDANIISDTEGKTLQYIQHKTNKTNPQITSVPLSDTAVEILDRYHGKQRDGRILPFIAEQNYNYAIKDILREAGITRLVSVLNTHTFEEESKPICDIASSHLARRSFISNVYEVTQEERLTISLSGHAEGSRALDRYIHIKQSTKRAVIDKLKGSRQ